MCPSSRVRKPAVAGSFYPGDPETLRRDIDSLLGAVGPLPKIGRPAVLIEPHAGYKYSGHVAAHGYKLIAQSGIGTVIVVSPSHMEYFPFVSIFDGDAYETPLGTISVAKDIAQTMVESSDLVKLSGAGHIQDSAREHALEIQLPFLQTVLEGFQIVPVVMGDQSWETCRALGDALGPILARQDVVAVMSSDLSHFYPDQVAQEMDGVFIDRLKQMDPWRLYESIKQRACEACGAGPVIAGLIAAQQFDSPGCRLLSRANSGDVTGDRDRVVGYACAVIFDGDLHDATIEATSASDIALGASEQTYLLERARHSIATAIGASSDLEPECQSPALDEKRGAFVTLLVRNRLRGCVGTIEPTKPIRAMTADMAVAAATGDPRFPSLGIEDLGETRIEISILSPLEALADVDSIEVGRHGLVVRKGSRSGLLLPQVATEQGWDANRFLEATCEKAGLAEDGWRDEDTEILTFTAIVFGEEKERTH